LADAPLRRAGLADAGLVAAVGGLAVLGAIYGTGWPPRRAAIAFMMGSWGARLAIRLLYTRSPRATDSQASIRSLVWRAFAAMLLSTPALVASTNASDRFSILELTAAAAWIVGFTGEVSSDHHRIRRYAFEVIIWIAFVLFAWPSVAQLVL
jgi:steroid 5-alpha reductase family enzyme